MRVDASTPHWCNAANGVRHWSVIDGGAKEPTNCGARVAAAYGEARVEWQQTSPVRRAVHVSSALAPSARSARFRRRCKLLTALTSAPPLRHSSRFTFSAPRLHTNRCLPCARRPPPSRASRRTPPYFLRLPCCNRRHAPRLTSPTPRRRSFVSSPAALCSVARTCTALPRRPQHRALLLQGEQPPPPPPRARPFAP